MNYEQILERIKTVYDQSVILYPPKKDQNLSKADINESSPHKIFFIEIDGNYLLFFNEIYTNIISKFFKNILKKLAWPVLKRQIYFNSAIRQLLYSLVQENYETSVMTKDINQKITHLEQKIEQLYQLEQKMKNLSEIEQRIEQLSVELQANKSRMGNSIFAEETKMNKD